MRWFRAIAVWLLMMLIESIHGTLRQLLMAPLIGDFPARQVSVFTGIVLIFLVALATIRWLGARSTGALLQVGALWVALTLLFELALGRLVAGYGWRRILMDYDLPHGGLMGLGLLAMLFVPLAAARLRRIRNAQPRAES